MPLSGPITWSIRIITSGSTTPSTIYDDTTAMVAAMTKWIIDSMPDDTLERKAMLSLNIARVSAPRIEADAAVEAGEGVTEAAAAPTAEEESESEGVGVGV